MKKLISFIFHRIVVRALVLIPMYSALSLEKFEILAIVSFILGVVGPWEIWEFIKEHGFEGFGVKIAGKFIKERDEIINEQSKIIDNLKLQVKLEMENVAHVNEVKKSEIINLKKQLSEMEAQLRAMKESQTRFSNYSTLDQILGMNVHSAKAAAAAFDRLR